MRKLSQPALLADAQFESPVGTLTCPVQVTAGCDSETDPETGFAPRVTGIVITTRARTDSDSIAAARYLSLFIVATLFEFASFFNMVPISFS
jgi:hypothetical protein